MICLAESERDRMINLSRRSRLRFCVRTISTPDLEILGGPRLVVRGRSRTPVTRVIRVQVYPLP